MKDDPVPFFSVVIPVRGRVKNGYLRRCLNSVQDQFYPNFECVVVDDGSRLERGEDVKGLVAEFADERFVYIRIEHSGRMIARNAGMAAARGEFIVWTDSDDFLNPMYLSTFHFHIKAEPEVRLWVCGCVVHGQEGIPESRTACKWTNIRPAWKPPLDPDGPGHKFFTSGKVGTGMFCFARECLEKTGLMPAWKNMYDMADGIHDWSGFPMDPPYFSAAKRWIGNPYGDDHAMFLALCKHFQVHLIKAALYEQLIR